MRIVAKPLPKEPPKTPKVSSKPPPLAIKSTALKHSTERGFDSNKFVEVLNFNEYVMSANSPITFVTPVPMPVILAGGGRSTMTLPSIFEISSIEGKEV